MKNLVVKTLAVLMCATLFVSCTRTSTARVSTVADFGPLCTASKEILGSEISPNGKWIAAECYWENKKEESPLQVVSLDHSKNWKIYFHDFVKGNTDYGRKNIIVPYRWSKDGRFLYFVSPTIGSGCCWIGGKYVLLARLNLETGTQEELLNTIDPSSTLPISFTISENDHYLLFTPITDQSYDFAVLDLRSKEIKVVKLEISKPIDLEFAVMSPNEDKIVLPLFKNIEFNNYVVDSIALADLRTNEQKVLISDLKEGEELYPVRWADEEHVLLSSTNPGNAQSSTVEYWLLNISTGQRERVRNP